MRLYTSELVKKYKARTVVDHVSIDVNQGEIVGLLGPNGAGKTTTFYMIVGLIKGLCALIGHWTNSCMLCVVLLSLCCFL